MAILCFPGWQTNILRSRIYNGEKMKKKKVLVVIQLLRRGGVELAALNFALHLNPQRYELTFYLLNPYENQDAQLVEELKQKNIKMIEMPPDAAGYIKKYRHLKWTLKQGNYDVVHSHVLFFSGFVMLAAKICGVKKRVSHSHAIRWNRTENLPFKIYKTVMQKLINLFATDKLACSAAAGDFLYGEKVYRKSGRFIANGVDINRFVFNETVRNEKRKELSITEDALLIGHIGTIYHVKNQVFLVKIFSEMLKTYPNAQLLLVGEELEREKVEEIAQTLGVLDKVIFAGQRTDIAQLLQAMDIMIFPSLFEALPVSLIEAQASQLPCLISDAVTDEVKYNDNVGFMSLQADVSDWANRAFSLLKIPRKDIRIEQLKQIYDIHSVAKQLEGIYEN